MGHRKVLIVGSGGIARRHAANWRALEPEAQIVFWHPHRDVATMSVVPHFENRHGVDGVSGEKWDVALICSPAPQHLEQARHCLRLGAHLLIEKPLGINESEIDEFQREVNESGKTVLVAYCLRFHPAIVKLEEMIRKQIFGRLELFRFEAGQYLPDWRASRDYRKTVSAQKIMGGGALYEISHELDLVNWFFGLPSQLMAMKSRVSDLEMDVEDSVEIIVNYPDTKMGSIHLNMVSRVPYRRIRLETDQGKLEWDAHAQQIRFHSRDSKEVEILWSRETEPDFDMYQLMLKHFKDCLEKSMSPRVSIFEGREAVAFCNAAHRSADQGIRISTSVSKS